tara:strand:- start:3350 stop:5338 length:1989 start_codon:yes stop_codon:yes gene_type:complete
MTNYKIEDAYSFFKVLSTKGNIDADRIDRIGTTTTRLNTDESDTIEYRFNNYGFRSDNDYYDVFYSDNDEDYIIGLGCSHTEGVGVSLEDTWLEKLGKKLGVKTVNLGLSGAGVDYCIYQLIQIYQEKSMIDNIKGNFQDIGITSNYWHYHKVPLQVYVLRPPDARLSIITSQEINCFQDGNFAASDVFEPGPDGELVLKERGKEIAPVISSWGKEFGPYNRWNNKYYKGQLQLFNVLQEKYRFANIWWGDYSNEWSKAADGMHYDESFHQQIADDFYDMTKGSKVTTKNINRTDYYKFFSEDTLSYFDLNAVIYEEIAGASPPLAGSLNAKSLLEKYEEMQKQGKHFILIIDRTESNWFTFDLHIKLHELCALTGIPPHHIVHISNDMKCDVIYENWFQSQTEYTEMLNFIPHPGNLHVRNTEVVDITKDNKRSFKIQKYKDRKVLPTKKFICLMGHVNDQREMLWDFFENNKSIKDSGHISYLGRDVCLPNSSTWSEEELCKNYWSSPTNDRLQTYHTDSYFSIVPEGEAGFTFSEKIHKPLLHGHPFILLSYSSSDIKSDDYTANSGQVGTGMLDILRSWGFQTFPELFDESYDRIDNLELRNHAIRLSIKRLCDMETERLHELCQSVEDKCIHNQKMLLSLNLPNHQLLGKLESLIND